MEEDEGVASAAAAVVAVLSGSEWLDAARKLLGISAGDELRLVEVIGVGKPTGFVGETLSVRVRMRATNGDAREALLFMKVVPRDCPVRQALVAASRIFLKESGLFNLLARLAPRLRPPTPLQPWGPRCLLAKNTMLLFEDLTAQGFKSLGGRATLDFAHCAAALETLARLHAASLALEEADRRARRLSPWRLGERFADILQQEVMFSEEYPNFMNNYFLCSLNAIKIIVGLMPQYKNSSRYSELLNKIDKLPHLVYEMVKMSDKHRNVICHGDLWVANIMFRYSSWAQVEDARLVDLQLTRYAPPALDVAALLHLCTRRELREEHGAELRELYYTALSHRLAGAGFPPEDVQMTRANFDASWKEYHRFGPIVAICLPGDLLPPLTLPESPGDLERFLTEDRADLIAKNFQSDEKYKERVSEIVEDLVASVLMTIK